MSDAIAVSLADIDEQREKGWPDFDPEDYCHRCGGRNVEAWSAPSPLWNAVMRGGSMAGHEDWNGIVCPQCFTELAVERGVVTSPLWQLRLDPNRGGGVVVELETTAPDGRVWDDERALWVDSTPGGQA